MARAFDRFMVDIELGSNPKIGRLNDREFRCLICGVWPLAAKASPRGYLAVAGQPATEADVAHQGRCSRTIAKVTLARLRELGMVELDDERGLEFCHDWTTLNPEPRPDRTNAERQQRYRERRNGVTNGVVTPPEVKEKEKTTSSLRSDVAECFAYWQERCNHPTAKLTADRRRRIEARLRENYTVHDVRRGIDGAARGAFVNESGKRFDDIELICRTGSKLEDFMGRTAQLRPVPNGRQSAGDLIRKLNESEAS